MVQKSLVLYVCMLPRKIHTYTQTNTHTGEICYTKKPFKFRAETHTRPSQQDHLKKKAKDGTTLLGEPSGVAGRNKRRETLQSSANTDSRHTFPISEVTDCPPADLKSENSVAKDRTSTQKGKPATEQDKSRTNRKRKRSRRKSPSTRRRNRQRWLKWISRKRQQPPIGSLDDCSEHHMPSGSDAHCPGTPAESLEPEGISDLADSVPGQANFTHFTPHSAPIQSPGSFEPSESMDVRTSHSSDGILHLMKLTSQTVSQTARTHLHF